MGFMGDVYVSKKYVDRDKQHYTPFFFLPPTIDHVLSGPAIEEVKMIRDERLTSFGGRECIGRFMANRFLDMITLFFYRKKAERDLLINQKGQRILTSPSNIRL